MDNGQHGMRATGEYVLYRGREYFAQKVWSRIWLFSDDAPLTPGFKSTSMDWVKGEVLVELSGIERLFTAQTTCSWRATPFSVGMIVGDSANISYLGKDFDEVGGLPGMQCPDKYEVRGRAFMLELTDVVEHVTEVPLGDQADDQPRKGPR